MATPPNPNEINTPRAPPPPSASTIPFTIPPLARGFLERFAAARAWWIGGASASDREEEEDGKIGGHAEGGAACAVGGGGARRTAGRRRGARLLRHRGGVRVAAAAAIDALPAFAYEPPTADVEDGGEGKPRGGGALCAVCLEDVVAGETVRRLPSCGHLFHVDCIDMWLHAHRTCPLCRRDLSPEKVTAKSSAAAVAAATVSSTDVLPPV
ncbi:hypothetical protein OsI_23248 [Oryza sativa Indica Group]|uniref:RING-type E3 ubiquitin transferase n=1 Tax=Oryza sativa subsp. indica TaxID=39946 RepID=B8B3C0_ORYSI|nr:hypothetical protein OsI_23248 [Oryza sativa Indica Group]